MRASEYMLQSAYTLVHWPETPHDNESWYLYGHGCAEYFSTKAEALEELKSMGLTILAPCKYCGAPEETCMKTTEYCCSDCYHQP